MSNKQVIQVKRIADDEWSRPRCMSVNTGKVYVDVSMNLNDCTKNGLAGDWHYATEYGEPLDRLPYDVTLVEV